MGKTEKSFKKWFYVNPSSDHNGCGALLAGGEYWDYGDKIGVAKFSKSQRRQCLLTQEVKTIGRFLLKNPELFFCSFKNFPAMGRKNVDVLVRNDNLVQFHLEVQDNIHS